MWRNVTKGIDMSIEDEAIERRNNAANQDAPVLPEHYSDVTKERITQVLNQIDRCTNNMVEAVFALLCDENNWNQKWADHGFRFRDGATNAQIGTHIGILQRGNNIKLDREGRDYWLKPLWDIGAIEKVYFDPAQNQFLAGHPIAKSPNSAYRLAPEFVVILESDEGQWQELANTWIRQDVLRERLALQATQAQQTAQTVVSAHSHLIRASHEVYASRFLPDYRVIYIDDGDGDRITEEQQQILSNAGITLTLHDAMPDVLLYNPLNNFLWVIEAVTSDGEVDNHKMNSLNAFAIRNNKAGIGFTTTYPTWKKAAERQSSLKNLANGSFMWIREDPSRNISIQQ